MRVRPFIIGVFLVLGILSTAGFFLVKMAAAQYHAERLLFTMVDPAGDDNGPGTYKYPVGSIFDPKKGHFDLTKFAFSRMENDYIFDLEMGRISNPWGAPEGFSHPTFQIYISTDPDTGKIETFREGAFVNFSPRHPWKYLLKVVSFNQTAVYTSSDYAASEGRSDGIKAFVKPDKKTIRVTVPRRYLPGDPENWMFYVLVGSQEGQGPDNFRPVMASPGQFTFGGGTDTDYDPNVIDLLAPAEGEHSQKEMLRGYNVADRKRAVIFPVGPTGYAPSVWEGALDRVAEMAAKLGIKL